MKHNLNKISYILFLNLSLISFILILLNILNIIDLSFLVNNNILTSFLIISLTATIFCKYNLDEYYHRHISFARSIIDSAQYFFISLLILLTANQFLKLDFLLERNLILIVSAIGFGFLTFYKNRDIVERELEEEKQKEEDEEKQRYDDFEYKFPRLNSIWGLKHIVRWMYKEGWIYSIGLILIFLSFILIKIGMAIIYNGSYLDEYFHIFSGISIFEEGKFAQFYSNQPYYLRGLPVSLIVGFVMSIFGKSLFIAKMVPAFFGIFNWILVYFLSKKLIVKKGYRINLLIIYSLIFTSTFNHYYIRMYFFYETLFLLFITFTYKINYFYEKNTTKLIYLVSLVLILNLLIRYFIGGTDANFINILTLIFLTSIIFFNHNKFLLTKKFIFAAASFLFTLIIFTVAYFNNVKNALIDLINPYGNYLQTIGYEKYFFSGQMTVISICFLLGIISVKKDNKFLTVFYAIGAIFIAHFLSPMELQLIRGIMYFIPAYLLLAFNFIEKLRVKWIYLFWAIVSISVIISSYPAGFFDNPYFEKEINYMDNDIFIEIAKSCNNSMIITSSRPWIFEIYNLKPDYYINTMYSNESWIQGDNESTFAYYDSQKEKYIELYSHTPIITNSKDFLDLISHQGEVCFVYGGLPYNWLDHESREILKKYFIKESEYKSNLEYNKMTLYKKF